MNGHGAGNGHGGGDGHGGGHHMDEHTSAQPPALSAKCSAGAQARRVLALALVPEGRAAKRPRSTAWRQNKLCATVRDPCDDIVEACNVDWHFRIDDPDHIRSTGVRDLAGASVQGGWHKVLTIR